MEFPPQGGIAQIWTAVPEAGDFRAEKETELMKLISLYSASLALTLMLPLSAAYAQDQTRDRLQSQTQDQMMDRDGYPISGYGMMSEQEREQFREQMRSMTPEQRQAFRQEHHQRMVERARARGVDIENLPPTAAGQKKGQGMMNDGQKGMMNGGGMNKSQDWNKSGGGSGGKQ